MIIRVINADSRLSFWYALWYILLISSSWLIFFLSIGISYGTQRWPILCTILAAVIFSVVTFLLLTYREFFNAYMFYVSLSVAVCLCLISLSFLVLIPVRFEPYFNRQTSDISPVGHFSLCTEVLLLIYTVIPLRLYLTIAIAITYSVLFEVLTWLVHHKESEGLTMLVRILLHFCIHVIGLHCLVMTNVRMRNTFMKVGQSLLVGQQLKAEKNLKESMLHSLMPPKVAQWLLSEEEHFVKNGSEYRDSGDSSYIRSLFRPFNMNRMENVSILFADIVGFTKISSTKSAEELVDILNKLFQKFDVLCKQNNCEKISTLGDCYYCVSGCPGPRPDHARCCVEMGLSMIQAIKQFVEETNEALNMRVGVHTGTVLCGIVGTRRFKFDVWSNDVTLANRMESTGKPGMVHISERTCEFLRDQYLLEEGEPVFGLKTYFILGKKLDRPLSYCDSYRLKKKENSIPNNSLQLVVSPPTSPHSMSPQTRPRVLSCDNSAAKGSYSGNTLSPDVCKIKASSLPSILDEQELEVEKIETNGNEAIKTPTSTTSSGRHSMKLKTSWKIPNFLRKSDQNKLGTNDANSQSHSNLNISTVATCGYQQVPTIIEADNNLQVPEMPIITRSKGSCSNLSTNEEDKLSSIFFEDPKDTIDVKSYISQSRSDIDYTASEFTSFMRSGSYRSQCGRSPNEFAILSRAGSNRSRRGKSPNFEVMLPPIERTRSATVTAPNQPTKSSRTLDVPNKIFTNMENDQLSMALSYNSRKDSGIKSNSRRSSIQQIEHQLPRSESPHHRLSGYFTSSQCSINHSHYPNMPRLPCPFYEKYGSGINHIRKQSDLQLIKCVQKNSESERSYFIKPPLSKLTLFFENDKMEQEYRKNVHSNTDCESVPTLANSRFNTYLDVFFSFVVFSVISFCLFLLYQPTPLWLSAFGIFVFAQICAIALCFKRISLFSEKFFSFFPRWYRWNAFGGLLVSLPLVSILCNFSCPRTISTSKHEDYLYSYLLFVGIVHFCNFTQLNCWMKNVLATLFSLIFVLLIFSDFCPSTIQTILKTRSVSINNETSSDDVETVDKYLYDSEILMVVLLLLILVWFLNREFEICYRLSFHTSFVANRDKAHVQRLKNQADWLIYNIVPEHVAEQLKKNAKYSENVKNAAIIFASIVNFNEMYDESYLGGKEFLRVLNELIGDFDELLTLPEFKSVEKIKTIGSTFMAASGLNSTMRLEQEDPNEHLYALMDFALAMQNVIENFNRDLLEFNLILRIGYNFGDVTAAVIGNTKLYYDIWGDAVNIASRMDSTGVNGRIQVGEHCLEILEKKYEFEKRGCIYVKGKDNMNVYLLKGKLDDTATDNNE
ncbi:adenylate cyclase type 9 isoform X2 [Agrilus planipennis]|uniref:Adenylate cyclase type 9 n=1 Tax=Agrilus planipennis TaxID=224129 RepID=A0A1W4X3J5_AGRPL|nr:adenylate cyclase type 9 isoform X2 [Agrilus planipennis]